MKEGLREREGEQEKCHTEASRGKKKKKRKQLVQRETIAHSVCSVQLTVHSVECIH